MISAPGEADAVAREIDELMTIIGVAPRDFAAVRANYDRLTPEEIHKRLTKFRSARTKLRARADNLASNETVAYDLEIHPRIPFSQTKFTTTNTLEALARLENVLDNLQPDILVGVNSEGMKVSNFVRRHMHLSAPIIEAYGTAAQGVNIDDFQPLEKTPVVVVIGHAAKSGNTLIEVMQQAMKIFKTELVFGGILLASVRAAGLLDKRPIYYHQIAENFLDSYGANAIDCLGANRSLSNTNLSPIESWPFDVVRREMAEMCGPAELAKLTVQRRQMQADNPIVGEV